MRFAPTKCHTLRITLKKNQSDFTYNLCNTAIEGVRFHKHLGVDITCTLNWSKQCEEVQKKANRVLAVLQRNIHSASPKVKKRAYQTLVRPITEYACAVWSPHTAKGIAAVESVQRRAARFVFNDYQRSTSVSSLINELNWFLLHERRTLIYLTLFYKIQYNLVLLPFPNDLTLNTSCTRKSHNTSTGRSFSVFMFIRNPAPSLDPGFAPHLTQPITELETVSPSINCQAELVSTV